MGFYVTASIEHDGESLDKFYVRMEQYKIEKPFGRVKTLVGHYKDEAGALAAIPRYVEDIHDNNAEGKLSMVHTYNGVEKEHEWLKYFHITQSEQVTVTTYSSSFAEQEVEFTDFDDDGNEITSTRTQMIETIHTGSAQVNKSKVNLDLITGSIYTWCYDRLKAGYEEDYGASNINDV